MASFVICTRNRKDVLLQCVGAALTQTVPVEVLVFDDGSSDGTAEALAEAFPPDRFPLLTYERHPGGVGPCALRNRGTRLARCEIVFPLDDDAVMTSPDTVEHVLREFDHPRVGAVAIPYINVRRPDATEHQRAPSPEGVYVLAEYLGASHAIRRSVFLAIGGYREEVFQYGEEGDVCLRMLELGYVCRAGTSAPIHHLESLSRNAARQNQLGPRNNVYLAYCNAPTLFLLPNLISTSVRGLSWGVREGTLKNSAIGLYQGYRMLLSRRSSRRPVIRKAFATFRHLRGLSGRAATLAQLERSLPPLTPVPVAPAPDSPTRAPAPQTASR